MMGRFRDALAGPGFAAIAEIKRRSPSAGDLRPGAEPAELASAFERAGAAAVSVLVDERFAGSLADLQAARSAAELPLLGKGFFSREEELDELKAAGADAALLLLCDLDDRRTAALMEHAQRIGLDILVEAHDMTELERAVTASSLAVQAARRRHRRRPRCRLQLASRRNAHRHPLPNAPPPSTPKQPSRPTRKTRRRMTWNPRTAEPSASPKQPPHPPDGTQGSGPAISFSRSNLTVSWDPAFLSLLDLAEACDVHVRWSCRTGVCHTCECGLVGGEVTYQPDPIEQPGSGSKHRSR